MTPDQKTKALILAESYSTNNGTLPQNEVDEQEIQSFVLGFAAGIIERNKELTSQVPRFQITSDISRKILSECEAWADWQTMSPTDKDETIEGIEGVLYLYHKQVYQQVVALQDEIKTWKQKLASSDRVLASGVVIPTEEYAKLCRGYRGET